MSCAALCAVIFVRVAHFDAILTLFLFLFLSFCDAWNPSSALSLHTRFFIAHTFPSFAHSCTQVFLIAQTFPSSAHSLHNRFSPYPIKIMNQPIKFITGILKNLLSPSLRSASLFFTRQTTWQSWKSAPGTGKAARYFLAMTNKKTTAFSPSSSLAHASLAPPRAPSKNLLTSITNHQAFSNHRPCNMAWVGRLLPWCIWLVQRR